MGTFDRKKVGKYACEFSGAMFLVLFVKLSVIYDDYTTSLSIGLGLGLLIYNYGYISGAHLNPSVTMALIVRNIPDFPISDRGQVAMYLISQYIGGICGGMIAWIIGGESSAGVYPTVFQNEGDYDDSYRLLQAFVGELFFTYLLCTTVIHTATDKRQSGNQFYGLCIGLSLSLGIACIGPTSGCCLNTAVWLGTVIPAILTEQINHNIEDAWIYWIATFLGGIIAGLWFNLLNGPESLIANERKIDRKQYDRVDNNLEMVDSQIE